MYGNPYNNQMYMQDLQGLRDRIDRQMQMANQNQSQQIPQINQNFQLAPNQGGIGVKYVNNIEDVKKELVFADTVFLDKEYANMWIKNAKGEIRTFSIIEIIAKDEKDLEIENLKSQIEELKGMMLNAKHDDANVNESTTSKKSSNVSNDKSSKK